MHPHLPTATHRQTSPPSDTDYCQYWVTESETEKWKLKTNDNIVFFYCILLYLYYTFSLSLYLVECVTEKHANTTTNTRFAMFFISPGCNTYLLIYFNRLVCDENLTYTLCIQFANKTSIWKHKFRFSCGNFFLCQSVSFKCLILFSNVCLFKRFIDSGKCTVNLLCISFPA